MTHVTLAHALQTGTLESFIAQEERRGLPSVDPAVFDAHVRAVTAPRLEGRTSRSPSHGGSAGR